MTQKNTETLQFSAEISKILQLMIHSLYTNRDIFLRELISNASDACDKLRYQAQTTPDLLAEGGDLGIHISFNKSDRTLTVRDNGIGMTREELIRNLGTIAKSGTQEFFSHITGDNKKDLSLIGQFGVGFYSAFMVADKVEVISRQAEERHAYRWISEGTGEFTVEEAGQETPRGTAITLYLKEDAQDYLDFFRLRHIIQTYSDHISFPITLTGEEGQQETANKASALWVRPKAEITEEQYQEFYRHVSHSPDAPWLTLHHKVEGKLEYTYLLFIPSIRPFDLFHPDRKRRVKLYVKRVFISDEGVDLVPHYLRFLRGVIDSEDLPLNISRETLQANPVVTKIRESVAKRVLADLRKKLEHDADAYDAFWNNFGSTLKEGLCEANSPREQILDACRFDTTSGDQRTTLDDYIGRMKDGQEEIYYLIGERLESVRTNPKLEGFRSRGVEVLLMSDHVDDFWLSLMPEYKGKRFKSITRADIDLNHFGKQDEKEEGPQSAESNADGQIAALIARMKEILGDQVSDVRTTTKLGGSAVCLAVEEGAMDIRLERFLVEQKQLLQSAAKILEINPQHPIIKALSDRIQQHACAPEVEDTVWLLLDQARILEGEEVADPAAFSRRLSNFMQKSLAA